MREAQDEEAAAAAAAAAVAERYDGYETLQIAQGERGRGLFVREVAAPREKLLEVDFDKLVNVATVGKYLKKELLPVASAKQHHRAGVLPLSSVQCLTLLLAQWHASRKDDGGGGEGLFDEDFEIFLRAFPKEYSGMPMFWHDSEASLPLLEYLPPNVSSLAKAVEKRYDDDIATLELAAHQHPEMFSLPPETDLAWAWAGVNSRCLYLPLGLKRSDNFTLAPFLDMANHTMNERIECKVKWQWDRSLELRAPAQGLQKGQEVCISYGPHSNGYLLAEYGFHLAQHGASQIENPFAEVNVDHIIAELFNEAKQQLLREADYWQGYTLHAHPLPAHPSHRLVIAMRLLASSTEADISAWKANVNGQQLDMGATIEKKVKRMLYNEICEKVKRESLRVQEALKELPVDDLTTMLAALHDEEYRIAQAVQQAIDQGHDDW